MTTYTKRDLARKRKLSLPVEQLFNSNVRLVVVSPSGAPDHYSAEVDGEIVCTSSRTPFCDAARILLSRGVDSNSWLILRHKGSDTELLARQGWGRRAVDGQGAGSGPRPPRQMDALRFLSGGGNQATNGSPPTPGSQREFGAMSERDLFGPVPAGYPQRPGSKSPLSCEAARKITPHANTVRKAVLAEFRAAYPRGLTADQVAKLLGESVLTVRPRVSELRAANLIEPTPERRRNESGMTAAVWRAVNKD